MRLDLRELIVNPERRLPFHLELETGDLDFPSVREYLRPPVADGVVSNEAGILHMRGTITAEMLCVCDRCGQEFESTKETAVDAVLVEEESEDNPELFVLEGTEIDAQEVLSTCFILDMETKFLCREDCKGLCAGKKLIQDLLYLSSCWINHYKENRAAQNSCDQEVSTTWQSQKEKSRDRDVIRGALPFGSSPLPNW